MIGWLTLISVQVIDPLRIAFCIALLVLAVKLRRKTHIQIWLPIVLVGHFGIAWIMRKVIEEYRIFLVTEANDLHPDWDFNVLDALNSEERAEEFRSVAQLFISITNEESYEALLAYLNQKRSLCIKTLRATGYYNPEKARFADHFEPQKIYYHPGPIFRACHKQSIIGGIFSTAILLIIGGSIVRYSDRQNRG